MARIFDFETNDRVIMIENNAIRKGVITQVFDNIPSIVIVKFDDGEIEKVNPQRLAIEPVPQTEEPKVEEKTEKTITISESEFTVKMAEMVVRETMKKDAPDGLMLVLSVFVAMAREKLFDESDSDA